MYKVKLQDLSNPIFTIKNLYVNDKKFSHC